MKRRKQKSLDEIHYESPEPHAEDTRNKHACLNWYNYMSDNKSCGEWLSVWMKDKGYEKEHYMGVKRLSYVPRTANLHLQECKLLQFHVYSKITF